MAEAPKTGTKPVDQYMGEQAVNPLIPEQGLYKPEDQVIWQDELIKEGSGQLDDELPDTSLTKSIAQGAERVQAQAPAQMTPQMAGPVSGVADTRGTLSEEAQAKAAQGTIGQQATAAQGTVQGTIDPMTGRTVSAQEQATAATADAQFLDPYQAAQSGFVSTVQGATMQVTPDMTVEGQLARLSQQFSNGQVPSWAAGAIRNANAQMAARGLSASSMAGAAITQAAMESALP